MLPLASFGLGGQVEDRFCGPDLLHDAGRPASRCCAGPTAPARNCSFLGVILNSARPASLVLSAGERLALRLLADPELDVAAGGRAAVGIDRRREDAVLQAGHQPAALGNQADADRLVADTG